jgi:hypothetical protein
VPPERIRVIFNSVDLARFRPRGRLPERPGRALLFSNYANEGTHLGAVREACSRAGLPLDVIGAAAGNPATEPEAVIGQYDLVFAKARCALEAMAVGSAVILCDFRGSGRLVTSADVEEFRRWNFGARLLRQPLDPQVLLAQIERYDPIDATRVSRRIRASAGLADQVDQLIALYREVLAEWRYVPPPGRRREVRFAGEIELRADEGIQQARLRQPLERVKEIAFAVRDGIVTLAADGQVCTTLAVGPQDAESWRAVKEDSTEPCRISITAGHCGLELARIILQRDVYYRSGDGYDCNGCIGHPITLMAEEHFVPGDHSGWANDSRFWQSFDDSLHSRFQVGTVPSELMIGVARCIYWPPARWRAMQ